MLIALTLLGCRGAATVGGVFFAFSSFVMKALAQLPPAQGLAAMQRINVVVLNPTFLGVFLGTALLAAGGLVAAWWHWPDPRAAAWLGAGLLYLIGSFGVTVTRNVPMNEAIAHLDPGASAAAGAWADYLRRWSFWNHVRTVASLASAGCCAWALTLAP